MSSKKRVSNKKSDSKTKKSKSKSKSKTNVSASVKKYVKKAISSNVENKVMMVNAGGAFGNVSQSPFMNAYPMTPYNGYLTIGQGVTQAGRIGNTIKPKRVMLNYTIRPMGYDVNTNPVPQPQEVDLYLGYVKGEPSKLPVSSDINQLYQLGSSVQAPSGNFSDLIASVNKDYWVIKKRWRHKVGFSASTGTGSNASAHYYNNNDYGLNVLKKLDITKYMPAIIKFNDSSATPTSRGLFFFYQCVNGIGTTAPASTLSLSINFWLSIEYEDA